MLLAFYVLICLCFFVAFYFIYDPMLRPDVYGTLRELYRYKTTGVFPPKESFTFKYNKDRPNEGAQQADQQRRFYEGITEAMKHLDHLVWPQVFISSPLDTLVPCFRQQLTSGGIVLPDLGSQCSRVLIQRSGHRGLLYHADYGLSSVTEL
ncbi:hypothetical protein M501DRAFT_996185, partial [Patellaria atrata CBS 101060]